METITAEAVTEIIRPEETAEMIDVVGDPQGRVMPHGSLHDLARKTTPHGATG